ncbi:MAG TPA: DUF3052 domain-containing protein [Actinomycetota bacterium]|nr:DUF3052 domain-containing protein [Actinomycetota bacterium]
MPPSDDRDYSATPLWRKLGIAAGARVLAAGAPEGFDASLARLAPLPDGVTFLSRAGRDVDVIVLFVRAAADLRRRFPRMVRALGRDGRLWVAWPKRASAVPTDLTFDLVQATGLGAGLVDNKSAAVDDVYQGLQFVYRNADRR